MTTSGFTSKVKLQFAEQFLRRQRNKFQKDIDICLTGKRRGKKKILTHAYFPALITCIGYADLMSGLYAGNVKSHGLRELKRYSAAFMNADDYAYPTLEILHECFRHKVAHLGHPYMVFDTATKPQTFSNDHMRLIWKVYARRFRPPIKIERLNGALRPPSAPWDTSYDHIVRISVRSLATDIVASIYGEGGYLSRLRSDETTQTHFKKCMHDFYPT